MAGFPAPFIKFREVDSNGDPLAGGKLYSYAAGTSTPLATYSDQGLLTPNANPTILDASGRASIWVEDGVAYKYILKDAAGNTIWTQDNVSVPDIEAPVASAGVPTGAVSMYGGTVAPSGYLMCDGSAVSRTTYSALFTAIGTAFGSGNGSTTFNVPDLRQRFPLGKAASGTGSTLGASGGTIDHVHAGPSHTHTINAHTHTISHTHTVSKTWTPGTSGTASTYPDYVVTSDGGGGGVHVATADQTTSAASTADSGSSSLTTNSGGTADTGTANPPYLSLNFIIKT